MKEVVKLIELHCNKQKVDVIRGLDVTTDYLIDCFDIRYFYKAGGWEKHIMEKKQESEELFKVLMIWMEKVSVALENGSWLDFFGEVYESMYQSKGKASALGQFFTPPAVCDLMAQFCGKSNTANVNDCACGSGRTLLAQWSCAENKKGYYIGDDIDYQSVKMCALNMMMHGMRGRVVRHDTLTNPILFDIGFELNEIRYPFPTPYYSLRKIHYTKDDVKANNEKLFKKYGDNVRKEKMLAGRELIDVYYPPQMKPKEEKKEEVKLSPLQSAILKEINKDVKPVQLSLFQ